MKYLPNHQRQCRCCMVELHRFVSLLCSNSLKSVNPYKSEHPCPTHRIIYSLFCLTPNNFQTCLRKILTPKILFLYHPISVQYISLYNLKSLQQEYLPFSETSALQEPLLHFYRILKKQILKNYLRSNEIMLFAFSEKKV